MKRRYLIWCLVVSMLASLLVSSRVYAAKSTTEQLNNAEDTYEDTKDKLDKENKNLDDLNTQKENLQTSLDDLTQKLETASGILEELDASISAKREQIDATWGRIEELATQIDQTQELADLEYEQAKEQIKFAYESGDAITLALLYGGSTYSSYINKGSYLQMLTEYRQNKIEALVETRKALEVQQSEYEKALIDLELEKAELDEYEARVSEQHEEINALIDLTSKKVKEYSSQIDETEARIDRYEAAIDEQANNIATLKAKIKEEKETITQAASAVWKDISNASYTTDERKLLANIIWCEAGNQPYEGQVAVGAVVMNRVSSSIFPNTISGVIYQKKQFTPATSGKLSLALSRDSATESCYRAADAAMAGVNNIGNCLYFRSPTSSVSPAYVIGDHYFY